MFFFRAYLGNVFKIHNLSEQITFLRAQKQLSKDGSDRDELPKTGDVEQRGVIAWRIKRSGGEVETSRMYSLKVYNYYLIS